MSCRGHQERSLAYLTGRLPEDQAAAFQGHLDGCPTCRARYAEEAELVAAFDLPTRGLAGPGFVAAVMGDIQALPGRASQPPLVQLHPWGARVWMPLLAAAAVALMVWWSGPGAADRGILAARLAGAKAAVIAWSSEWSALLTAAGESGADTYRASQALVVIRCPGFDACVEVAAAALLLSCIGLVAGFRRTSARSL